MVGRLGGVEVGGGGGGAGAGGFWASVTGARSVTAITVRARVRMGWLIDRFLGRKHAEISKIVGRVAVQVKVQDSKARCAPARRLGLPR